MTGSRRIASAPTAMTTTISQPMRERAPAAGSERARSAVTGLTDAARRAGSRAATSVTRIPTARPASRTGAVSSGASRVTLPTAPSQAATSSARAAPPATPSSEPAEPSSSAWTSTIRTSWPRVAPAARSRPSSRIRSTTVIDVALRTRKAAANSVIDASSAIVARMSAVEARIDAATSRGAESTYGSVTSASSMAPVTASTSAPGARTTSTRVMPCRA